MARRKRKSAKRVAAGKKAWRSRRRRRNPGRSGGTTVTAKQFKAAQTRARRAYGVKKAARTRKSAKRVAAGRKAARTRKRRYGSPKVTTRKRAIRRSPRRRTYRMRRTPRKGPARKMRRGTYHRYSGPRGRTYYRLPRRKRSKRTTYRRWRNTAASIRTRNPGAMDIILPVATGIGGLVLAGLLMKKLPVSITSKIPTVAGINLGVLIPAAAGVLAMKYLTKKIPKHSKIIYGLSFGLILASGMALYNTLLAPKLKLDPIGGSISGYVTTPFSGYVPARGSMAGYVRSNLGQLEQRLPGGWSSMGEPVQFFGARPQGMLPPGRAALNYQPLSSKPYGLGLPREERRYDDWNWSGVYDSSVYE